MTVPIIVEIKGLQDGNEYTQYIKMEAQPEESLVSIVDRIDTTMDDFKVRQITFVEEV